MQRRAVLKAGLGLPLGCLLAACGRKDRSRMTAGYQEGMYLAENYAPVDQELTVTRLETSGQIPEELTGRFLRIGPNPIGQVDPGSHHWFIGEGMVHGVRLEGGRADWYRNRWVQSQQVAEKLRQVHSGALPTGSPNTHVISHAGRTWALVEAGTPPVELGYELDTLGHQEGWGAYSPHPLLDPATGELHAIVYDYRNWYDHVKYLVVASDSATVTKTLDIPIDGMPMMHSMSLTANYLVLYDLPVTLSFLALAMGSEFPFRWDDGHEPRIGLLPRDGTAADIAWHSMPEACYAFHPMNAFEDGEGRVVMDMCRYDRIFVQDTNGPFGDASPRLERWTLNPGTGKVSMAPVDDRPQEFPRIHPQLAGRPYRYGYTLEGAGRGFPALLKHDLATGRSERLDLGPGRHGAEPVFVPRAGAQAEDDGYLLSFVYDQARHASELLIADAQDLARGAIASVRTPRVPYGFHGSWVPDA